MTRDPPFCGVLNILSLLVILFAGKPKPYATLFIPQFKGFSNLVLSSFWLAIKIDENQVQSMNYFMKNFLYKTENIE